MATEKDIKEKLADKLSDFGRARDEMSDIGKQIENILVCLLSKHFPYDKFMCKPKADIDRDPESGETYLTWRVEFPDYCGAFSLSDLTKIKDEAGADEIAVDVRSNSPVSLLIVLRVLPPFK